MSEVPWSRLSIRVVYLDLLRLAVAFATGYLGSVLDGGAVRPLFIAAAIGALGAVMDLRRWMTSRYRVTDERVELRSGWLIRRYRAVPRDRIRSVDSNAPLRHRLLSIRVVQISSGEAGPPFRLDALTTAATEALRRDLMPGAVRPVVETAAEAEPGPAETVIARLRWRWVALNAVSLWAPFAAAAPLLAAYTVLRPFGVDLLPVAERVLDWHSRGIGWTVALCLTVAVPVGIAVQIGSFYLSYANFTLTRVGAPPDTALVTRKGLLDTREVHRDDRRIRGLAFDEPLIWRWLRLTDTHLVTTGQDGDILPTLRRPEAHAVAGRILPDGHRPWRAPLLRHPRSALTRGLSRAVLLPALAAATLWVYGRTGALPSWWWPAPLALLPVTVPLAVLAYRSLGHALAGPYLVLRHGAVTRRTVALQHRAVIGWSVRQSVFQRWSGRATLGVATAAGETHYEAPDAGVGQALALIAGATPQLAAHVIEDRDYSDVDTGDDTSEDGGERRWNRDRTYARIFRTRRGSTTTSSAARTTSPPTARRPSGSPPTCRTCRPPCGPPATTTPGWCAT